MVRETLHFADAAVGVASIEGVFVNVWRGETTKERIQRVVAAQRATWERTPKQALVTVIESTTPLVGNEERELGNRLFKQSGPHLLAVAYVIEGTGFFAAAARAYVTTTTLLRVGNYATKSFSNPRNAATWIAPMVTAAIGPTLAESIVTAVETARRAIR